MTRRILTLLSLMLLAFANARGQNRAASPDASPDASPARQYFTDVLLVDQNGRKLRLYSDLLEKKIVVVNTFFASCDNSCPRMAAIFSGLQDRLGDQLGNQILLLSLTVDPEADTPERLKAYAERFHARPGWIFLTGTPENVRFALNKFGQRVERKEDHFNLFVVGNEATGLWKKVLPMHRNGQMLTAPELMEVVASVIHDQQ